MKIQMPAVTLVVHETRCHELMRRTALHALTLIEPGEVVVCSDNFNVLRIPGARHHVVPDWPTKLQYEKFTWTGAWVLVRTPFALFMEWDAGVWRPEAWSNKFLETDYIGAPWWYGDGRNVGNGGLSLRSKCLMDVLQKHSDIFPVREPGDDTLCRKYRSALEIEFGMKWADEPLASQFSFESRERQDGQHFGYHAMRNWVRALDRDELVARTKLAMQNRYVRGTSMLQQLFEAMPSLRDFAA